MNDKDNQNNDTGVTVLPPDRLPNGKFAPGNRVNIEGKGGIQKGYQPIGQRFIYLAEKYTPDEIMELANDPKRRRKELCYWDSLAVMRMARAEDRSYTVTDSGADQCLKESNFIVDRIEGTAVQTVRTSAIPPITKSDIDNIPDSAVQETLDRLNQA